MDAGFVPLPPPPVVPLDLEAHLPPPPEVAPAEIPCAEKIANCRKLGLLPIIGTVVGICAIITVCRKDEPTRCGRVAEIIAQIFSFTVLPSLILGMVYIGQAIADCCAHNSTEEIVLPPPPGIVLPPPPGAV